MKGWGRVLESDGRMENFRRAEEGSWRREEDNQWPGDYFHRGEGDATGMKGKGDFWKASAIRKNRRAYLGGILDRWRDGEAADTQGKEQKRSCWRFANRPTGTVQIFTRDRFAASKEEEPWIGGGWEKRSHGGGREEATIALLPPLRVVPSLLPFLPRSFQRNKASVNSSVPVFARWNSA